MTTLLKPVGANTFTKNFFDLFEVNVPHLSMMTTAGVDLHSKSRNRKGLRKSRRSDSALRRSALLSQYSMTQP
jgi:hypothetical protein